jgi:hypothetical protein
MHRSATLIPLCLAGLLAAPLPFSGCTSRGPIAERNAGLAFDAQPSGPTAALVMAPAIDSSRLDASGAHAWRDRSLALRPPRDPYTEAAWPATRRPSIDRPGRIYLNTRSDTFLYFRAEGVHYHSQRSGWHWAP